MNRYTVSLGYKLPIKYIDIAKCITRRYYKGFSNYNPENAVMEVIDMDKVICETRSDEGIRFFDNDLCGSLRTINACGDKHVIEADEIINNGGRDRVINGNIRIRKLTPTECYKLQGFTAEDCKKASDAGVSNSQLYKQAGNSICVSVLEALYKSLGERYEEFRGVS